MFSQILIAVALATIANAGWIGLERGIGIDETFLDLEGGGLGRGGREGFDTYAVPKYEFNYGVGDPKTRDRKEQTEVREGDRVKGEYSLAEPDGTIRVVKYTADDKNGFNARVERIGKSLHPSGWRGGI